VLPLTCQLAPIRYLSPSFQRGYWERRHGLRTFGSDEMPDSDESWDLFELYVGDGNFAQHTGFSEEEYNRLIDEVLPLSTGHRLSVLSLTDHNRLVTTLVRRPFGARPHTSPTTSADTRRLRDPPPSGTSLRMFLLRW